jgi:hypothetical protein
MLRKRFSVLVEESVAAVGVNDQGAIRQPLLNVERVDSRNHVIVLNSFPY